MKKKIKDLTLEECEMICKKERPCLRCPLFVTDYAGNNICPVYSNSDYYEREVEIDE